MSIQEKNSSNGAQKGATRSGECWNEFFKIDQTSVSEKVNFYTANAPTYDIAMSVHEYNGTQMMAELIHSYFKSKMNSRLIFIPAGTGNEILQLQTMSNHGYTDITALDASPGMLKILKQKNITHHHIECMFVKDCQVPSDTYDAAISVGGFVPDHLQIDALSEMCRIVRPGGLVIIMMRESYLYECVDYDGNKFFDEIDRLVADKKWQRVEHEVVQNYFADLTGIKFVYRKL